MLILRRQILHATILIKEVEIVEGIVQVVAAEISSDNVPVAARVGTAIISMIVSYSLYSCVLTLIYIINY